MLTCKSKLQSNESASAGFTIVEVLVCIFIITALVSLVVPAVLSAREAARRLACASSLKQLGLATINYSDVHGFFPKGRTMCSDPRFCGSNYPCDSPIVDKSIFVTMLPFIDSQQIYNSLNANASVLSTENITVRHTSVSLLACPSDFGAGSLRPMDYSHLMQLGFNQSDFQLGTFNTSYAGVFGSYPVLAVPRQDKQCIVSQNLLLQSNGCFNDLSNIGASSITDGLSQTLLLAEHATGQLSKSPSYYNKFGWFFSGNLGDTLVTAFYPPNLIYRVPVNFPANVPFGASSFHPNGFQVAMADGSVRFISNTIESWPISQVTGTPRGAKHLPDGSWNTLSNPGVWQKISTRNGQEVLSNEY